MAKKILIVDDETQLLELLALRFNAAGFETATAKDGIEALEQVEKNKPDLMVLDILMPRMDGYEVCRLLKFDERYKSLPILMLTAKSQEIDKETAQKVGADAYVTKPFNVQELLDKINSLI